MAKKSDQKLKLLYIMQLLVNESEEDHPVTMRRIIDHLDSLGIKAERKSIYDDIRALQEFGMDILLTRGPSSGYYLASRVLELHELKVLSDAVLSSRFLTTKKTRELTDKLSTLTTLSRRKELKRRVHVMRRLKSSNEQIYYNIDGIQMGLNKQRPISFYYTEWVIEKSQSRVKYYRRRRHDNKLYVAYPIEVIWDDENYYLLAKMTGELGHRTFRVDRMENISVLDDVEDNEGKQAAARFDPASYSNSVFDMYDGRERNLRLSFHESMLQVILDRFGEDIFIEAAEEPDWYQTTQVIRVSDRFYGWLLAFDDQVRLVGPDEDVKELASFLKRVSSPYKIGE